MPLGYASWNAFLGEIRGLRQIYDFTAHLYARENEVLAALRNPRQPGASLQTSIGTVTHNVNRLFEYTSTKYPERLRQLLLISAVAYLEGYLAELILEIATRTLEPFKVRDTVEFSRGRFFAASSIDHLREEILIADIRKLTSGGFHEFGKYYRTRFEIEFASCGKAFEDLKEVHDRRHLHVHRNGLSDAAYVHRYPSANVRVGDTLPVPQDYLLAALGAMEEFGERLRDAAMARFPLPLRRRRTESGPVHDSGADSTLAIKLEVVSAQFDPLVAVPAIVLPEKKDKGTRMVQQFLLSISVEAAECICIVRAGEADFRDVMYAIKRTSGIVVRSVWRPLGG